VTHKDARPVIYGKDKHGIEREAISKCAKRTCEELQRAGYLAFVVGGAVRDLLVGMRPKDFDIATNATPDEVRSVFRRSRIIGRRFQIVHVLCGADTVEVSTFRAHFTREIDADRDEHGRVLSDNVFGTQAEDALRRDFTVNALFYDPVKEEVWDYVHGLRDLKARKLVMIGNPATRYREDPVRMLRAARLAAKLGFVIDPATREPIEGLRHLLENVPQSRLFEEILKLLLSGNAVESVRLLRELKLHHGMLPLLDTALDDPETGPFAMAALRATDERLAAGKPVSPAFLLAALLWGRVEKNMKRFEEKGLAADTGAAFRDARGPRCPARFARHSQAFRRDHEGAVAAAAALPAARRPAAVPAARASAVPRGLRLLRAARGFRERAAGYRALVGAVPGSERGRARGDARRRRERAEEEAPAAARKAQARRARGREGRGRGVTEAVRAAIALGSNIQDPEAQVRRAFDEIAGLPRTHVLARSSLYRTEPVGYADQPMFVNACALVETSLAPRELLDGLLAIEQRHGRVREIRNGPRTLDLDIVLYGDRQVTSRVSPSRIPGPTNVPSCCNHSSTFGPMPRFPGKGPAKLFVTRDDE
jgi:2-amino-4-hydroxy-6-hydroxymethyldihydropteridine diphosphokinase